MRHLYRERNGRYYVRIQIPKSFKRSHPQLVPKSGEIRLSLYSTNHGHGVELAKACWLAARDLFRSPDLASLGIKTLADLKNHIRASVVTHLPQQYTNLIELTGSADKHHLQAAIKLLLAYKLKFYLLPPQEFCDESRYVQNVRYPNGTWQHCERHPHGKQYPHSSIDSELVTQAVNKGAERFLVERVYYQTPDDEWRIVSFRGFMASLHQLFVSTDLPANVIAAIRRATETRPISASINVATESPKSNLVLTEMDAYCKHKQKKWGDKTKDEFRTHLDIFLEMIGGKEKEILQITTADCDYYIQNLPNLPPNMRKNKLYAGKTIKEVLAMRPTEVLSKKTVATYFGTVRGFIQWASIRDDNKGMNISLLHMRPESNERDNDGRLPFSPKHLSDMFEGDKSIEFLSTTKHPYQVWIGPIALVTGARIGEICALRLEDVGIDEDGTHYIQFNANEKHDKTRKGKTANSVRRLPMHKILVQDLNLPAFANYMRTVPQDPNDGPPRLFPECTYVHKHGYKKSASRWWNNNYKRDLLKIADKQLTFHCFRNTVSEQLAQVDSLKEWRISRYFGHRLPADTPEHIRSYFRQQKIGHLLPVIENIKYPINWTKYAELCRKTYK